MNFTHWYDKLDYPIFTTIRSVGYMAKHNLKINDVESIYHKKNYIFSAILIAYQDMKIEDMDIQLLRFDANSKVDGIYIHNHQGFVDLINSFIQYKSNRLTTRKRIMVFVNCGD